MFKVKDIAYIGIMTALTIILKISFDWLPNIEFVSFLLILFTLTYGIKTIFVSLIFCVWNMIMYGIGDWVVVYFIVYCSLVLLTHKFKDILIKSNLTRALFSGVFGLTFGIWFAISWGLISQSVMASFIYYANGITFDIAHMIGNFVIMYFLSNPCLKALNRAIK